MASVSRFPTLKEFMGTGKMRTKIRTCVITSVIACAFLAGSHGTASQVVHQRESHAAILPEERVDINSATVQELLKVPGMTQTWAGRIVRFRPYRSKDDLVLRGVLSSDVYGRIKSYVIAHREKQ
jgi:DNA uptake protein ComE-like DNA-binding protein